MTDIKPIISALADVTAKQPLREISSPKDIPLDINTSPAGTKLHSETPLDRAAQIVESHINEITGANRKFRMEKNEEADRIVYKVIDAETEEIIRQYPPEDLLKLIAYYRHVEGLGIDDSV